MLKRASLIVAGAAMLVFGSLANADEHDKKTTLTFSQPVEVPGVVLPAGTYVFKLADLKGTRNIVQVFNSSENEVLATFIAVPREREQPHDKTYIGFKEQAANAPMAIHEWFYPGHITGLEFVYPKPRAIQLAQETKQPVLAAEVKPSETPTELQKEPVVEVTPEKKEVEVAEVYAPPEPAAPAKQLPSTASPMGLLALLGFGSLALAGGVGAILRKN
jgi:hypothetical protein